MTGAAPPPPPLPPPAFPFRVWVDAQLPPALAAWMRRELAVDAVHVEDLGLHRAEDPPIFRAVREAADVVVLTKDEDFAQLVDRLGPPPRVVWLRCGNVKNAELRRIVGEVWPEAARLVAAGEPLVEVGRR